VTDVATVPAYGPEAPQDASRAPCGCDHPADPFPGILAPENVTLADIYAELLAQRAVLVRLADAGDNLAGFAQQLAPVVDQLAGGGLGGMLGALLGRRG